MRLINADALMQEAYESEDYNRATDNYDLPVVAVYDIENAPTIDAVCVVRCRDCVYHATSYSEECVYCNMLCRAVPEDGYCMYGERRESE